ncbi:hypothetical protein [Cesiribacter andamanensis]|uniref:Lipocalin-like domain-containing protein n=1 Tax=Cesiribacter andamanensis AMV16 TaxID=1279009 RepID=M7P157_9BACT|nr:hypothetical protein [Cesiribacter andamanensis]EMR04319.1 hypothetical protein ADICEAN_00482 [Cesiribacter andamanensis AMV16]
MKTLGFFTLLLLSALLLTANRCGGGAEDYAMPDSFYGSWIHSHEEDYSGYQVYRHPSFNFPPSRGRERFDIRPKGVLLYYAIAPTDGQADPEEGRWLPLNQRTIEVSLPKSRGYQFSAELIEIANDRLVIRKLPE